MYSRETCKGVKLHCNAFNRVMYFFYQPFYFRFRQSLFPSFSHAPMTITYRRQLWRYSSLRSRSAPLLEKNVLRWRIKVQHVRLHYAQRLYPHAVPMPTVANKPARGPLHYPGPPPLLAGCRHWSADSKVFSQIMVRQNTTKRIVGNRAHSGALHSKVKRIPTADESFSFQPTPPSRPPRWTGPATTPRKSLRSWLFGPRNI